jgi:hypothetical protein
MRKLLVVLLLSGCATQEQVAYEPTCARQCFNYQSQCSGNASGLLALRACDRATDNCLSTCKR